MTNISDIIAAPWTVYILFAAVRLKLFTALSDQQMTANEIAEKIGAKPRPMKGLLDACVGAGWLRIKDGRYSNSDFSRTHFIEGTPLYMGDFINLLGLESSQWFDFPEIIMGKDLPSDQQPKAGADLETYIRGMHNLGLLGEADALAKAVDLSGFTTMIDAGGGSGIYSVALCKTHPGLHSTLLDTEEVLNISRKLTESYPERDRISFRAADATEDPFGEGIDMVLVSDVVYDKPKADKVLKNALDCLNPGGLLVVRGYYADPENTNPKFGALFIMNVLISGPDREILSVRTLQDCVQEAGFIDVNVTPLTERSTVLTARKP